MIDTNDRIKALKYKLKNTDTPEKEKVKILNLIERAYNPYESKSEMMKWFDDLKEMTEDMFNE